MAGRARLRRGKHAPHSKKRKGRRGYRGIVSQLQSVSLADEATDLSRLVTPLATVLSSVPTAVKCPNLFVELRRVSILAGLILAILLVLVLVLG
jgi:hypothetical protein